MIFFFLFSEETKYPDIKVCDFLNHVRALHADSDNGFSNEFEDITSQTRTDLMADASYLPENKAKNRYVNISACKYIFLSILLFMVIIVKVFCRVSDLLRAHYRIAREGCSLSSGPKRGSYHSNIYAFK